MKLIETIDGFGRLELATEEQKDIDRLFEIMSSSDPPMRYSDKMLSKERITDKTEFVDIVHRRFTGFPFSPDSYGQYHVSYSWGITAAGLEHERGISISSGRVFSLGNKTTIGDIALFRKDGQYLGHLELDWCYKCDCEDDIVELLGRREKPIINRMQTVNLCSSARSNVKHVCSPDIISLPTLFSLYERAQTYVDSAPQTIGLSREQINILRQDALAHENVFIRDGSKQRYYSELTKLIEQ